MAQIYELINKAMNEVGAIGKDSFNPQQKYKFRGIDAVMNALNPVMQRNGLFCTPEVLNQVREERATTTGGTLKYSILTMRYTIYAPDGSNVSAVVIGEGMDSGDKASNKAMSVAFKYAMFQLFCIPTEEFVDPDSETPPPSKPVEKKPEPKPEPKPVVTVNIDDAKARSLQLLKQNAKFAYGPEQYEAKLSELLAAQGVTFETMTNTAYKTINKQIVADIAAKGAA